MNVKEQMHELLELSFHQKTKKQCNVLADIHSTMEKLLGSNELLVKTLGHAREKLELYRDHSNGQYHGGIEYTALIRMIDTSIAVTKL